MSTVTISCDCTRRELTLGAANSTTGWYGKTYTATTIKGLIEPKGISKTTGMFNRFPNTYRTADVIYEGDELIGYDGKYYVVNGVYPWSIGDNFQYFECDLDYQQFHSDRPVTYGTGASTQDSRQRSKVFIDTWVSDAAITNDSGSQADWISCWSGFDYPLYKVMLPSEKNVDGIYCINPSTVSAHLHANKSAYAYTEQVPIQIITANKAGITADNLQNKMAQELRRIIEQYPLGSLRSLGSGKPDTLDSKNQIYGYTYTMTYKRAVETVPTYPTITYGANQASTYTIPNITQWNRTSGTYTSRITIPSRMGNLPQKMGMPDYQLTLHMDVTMSPLALTWERSQTTVTKTDSVPEQVFLDIQFNGQNDTDQAYQILNMGWGNTLNVTVEDVNRDGDDLTVTFNVYSNTAPTDYKDWFGLYNP